MRITWRHPVTARGAEMFLSRTLNSVPCVFDVQRTSLLDHDDAADAATMGLTSTRRRATRKTRSLLHFKVLRPSSDGETSVVLSDCLGTGAYRKTFRGKMTENGDEVAVKIIPTDNGIRMDAIMKEVCIQQLMDGHPNIVDLLDLWRSEPPEKSWYLVMQLAGVKLDQWSQEIGQLPPATIRCILDHLAYALQFCHSVQIVHANVNPAHVFIDANRTNGTMVARLADFSIALWGHPYQKKEKGHYLHPITYTKINYRAPELTSPTQATPETSASDCVSFSGDAVAPAWDRWDATISFPIDMWALGVVIAELGNHNIPLFQCEDNSQLRREMKERFGALFGAKRCERMIICFCSLNSQTCVIITSETFRNTASLHTC